VCVGISWKGSRGTNNTVRNPQTPKGMISYSGKPQRSAGGLGMSPGWIPAGDVKSQWMQLDLGEDRDINGIASQARGNNWGHAITSFRVQYATNDDFVNGANFTSIPGTLQGPTVDYLTHNYSSEVSKTNSRIFKAFFPASIVARYVRLLPVAWHGSHPVLRAEVLLSTNDDMFNGRHTFRRCLETDGYTRLVRTGSLTESESRGFTVPNQFTKVRQRQTERERERERERIICTHWYQIYCSYPTFVSLYFSLSLYPLSPSVDRLPRVLPVSRGATGPDERQRRLLQIILRSVR